MQTFFPHHSIGILRETNEIQAVVKSPRPDGMVSEILKITAEHKPRMLLRMYNCCFKEGIFPEI